MSTSRLYYPPGVKPKQNNKDINTGIKTTSNSKELDPVRDSNNDISKQRQLQDKTVDSDESNYKLYQGKFVYNDFLWFNVIDGKIKYVNDNIPINLPITLYVDRSGLIGYYDKGTFTKFDGSKWQKTAIDAVEQQQISKPGPDADITALQTIDELKKKVDEQREKLEQRDIERRVTSPSRSITQTVNPSVLTQPIGNRIQAAEYRGQPDTTSITKPKFNFDKSLINTWGPPIFLGLGLMAYFILSEKPSKQSVVSQKADD